MSQRVIYKHILWGQAIFFIIVLITLWLVEVYDFPGGMLGEPETPVNWQEALVESFVIIVLGGTIMWWTVRLLRRIQYLEGFLPMCSFCKRIRVKDEWIPVDSFISEHSDAVCSHGLCPDCSRENYGIPSSQGDSLQ